MKKMVPVAIAVVVLVGCQSSTGDTTQSASRPDNAATSEKSVQLYSDAEIKKIAMSFEANPDDGLLNVVPNGESQPVESILATLDIDSARLEAPTTEQWDRVLYYTWKLSPSYELSIMTAFLTEPLEGYGVRLTRTQERE